MDKTNPISQFYGLVTRNSWLYGGTHIYKNFWLNRIQAWEAIMGHWYWNYKIDKRRSKSGLCMLHLSPLLSCQTSLPVMMRESFPQFSFFRIFFKFLTGKTWEIGPRSNCHVDNSAATLQNLKILINLFHFDRISQFWPDFTILNKSQNFDQVSWFLVYFTITNLMIFWHDVLPQDFEIMGKAGKIVRLVRILISQHFANCLKSPREVSEIWNKFRHSESWTPTKNGFEDNESPISKGCSSRWEWWG